MSLLSTVVFAFLLLAVEGLRVKLQSAGVKSRSLSMVSTPISPIQDVRKVLAGSSIAVLSSLLGAKVALAAGATYLKEPTPEFVDEEKKVAAFLAQQKRIRQEWDAIIAKLSDATGTSALESDIKELTAHLRKYNTGIPNGVKKADLVKLCRSKKFVPNTGKKVRYQPEWTTEVEIAYQELIQEFNRQVSPKPESDKSLL